jgi:23S rRNA pseudouridine2605 synthase
VSLERAVSKLGIASRPEARAMILARRVRVGRRIVTNPRTPVDLTRDRIWIDGRLALPASRHYWVLNKPIGYVTTRRDPEGRPTVYDLLPPGLPFVSPVGRLDLLSSGLLLFTNDTQLGAGLTAPESHVAKVYEVWLDKGIGTEEAARLAAGVDVQGRRTRPSRVELLGPDPSAHLVVTIVEGRNRQVRRMFETLGRTVVRLVRLAIGPLRLEGLAEGEARPLHPNELRSLRTLVGRVRAPAE